jgi:hypothetical protein
MLSRHPRPANPRCYHHVSQCLRSVAVATYRVQPALYRGHPWTQKNAAGCGSKAVSREGREARDGRRRLSAKQGLAHVHDRGRRIRRRQLDRGGDRCARKRAHFWCAAIFSYSDRGRSCSNLSPRATRPRPAPSSGPHICSQPMQVPKTSCAKKCLVFLPVTRNPTLRSSRIWYICTTSFVRFCDYTLQVSLERPTI